MEEGATVEQNAQADQAETTVGESGGDRDDLAEQLDNLKRQLEGEKAKAEDYLRRWQRAQADFVNFKRRVEQERADLLKYANASLVSRLLSVLDDFDRADRSLPESLHRLSWIEGVLLIRLKLMAILQQEGLVPIEAKGKDFDPVVHEAVIVEPGVDPGQGKVVEELQPGYKLGDRVIRPTLVRVGRLEEKSGDEQTGEMQTEQRGSSDRCNG